ncbi:MAG: YiaA/YiaB family inner membrane protein [Halioglobus sp.]
MEQYELNSSSSAWDFFVKVSFAIAIAATGIGIYLLPGELVIKGYFLISSLFLVFATITMSKTVRDGHESDRLHNKISEARTSKIIRDMDIE